MISILVFITSFLCGTGHATPMYYTFEGTVDESWGNSGVPPLFQDLGYQHGSQVTYIFLADFEADGFVLFEDGTSSSKIDAFGSDFFFAKLVYTSPFIAGNRPYEVYYGKVDDAGPGLWQEVGLYGTLGANSLAVEHWNASFSDLHVGMTSFQGWQTIGELSPSTLYSHLTLTAITSSNPAPIPEPGSLNLFLAGLTVVAGAAVWQRSSTR
jgi:hypothetical protein